MKRGLHVLLAVALAWAMIGCQPAAEKKPSNTPSDSGKPATTKTSLKSPSGSTTVTAMLVKLKVPSMV